MDDSTIILSLIFGLIAAAVMIAEYYMEKTRKYGCNRKDTKV